jgi:hypothetical protein
MRPSSKPRPPSYGGSTVPGQIRMTDGSRWTIASRDPAQTILVHVIASPLRRLRLGAARIPLLRGIVLPLTQFGIVAALGQLTQPRHPRMPTDRTDEQLLTATAIACTLRLLLLDLGITQASLLLAAAAGGTIPGLASVLAALGITGSALLFGQTLRRAIRTLADQGIAQLHGAEHQAINCTHRGLALTDANIAASPTSSPSCGVAMVNRNRPVLALAAAGLELRLPGWAPWLQALAGVGLWAGAAAVSLELGNLLGRLRPARPSRSAAATLLPGQAAHRELAARALAPLLPPDQQALVGPFPSPLVVSVSPAAKQASS